MSKYEVKRTNLCYSMDNETVTDANDIFSFRANVEGGNRYWCGFYDFDYEQYRIFPSGADEMYCLALEALGDESLSNFEARLQAIIYDHCDELVKLAKVADDCSIMNEMRWTSTDDNPKAEYGWE